MRAERLDDEDLAAKGTLPGPDVLRTDAEQQLLPVHARRTREFEGVARGGAVPGAAAQQGQRRRAHGRPPEHDGRAGGQPTPGGPPGPPPRLSPPAAVAPRERL